ncbi:unnamed protein product [Effrenium voratum]|uniref:Uncharacterized protein n=1 Tax=Effrenium voratum TaxID=2562239 RepID=A0AA36N5C1_9DINO|nr:unnamed protein product [Effrenium voratum]
MRHGGFRGEADTRYLPLLQDCARQSAWRQAVHLLAEMRSLDLRSAVAYTKCISACVRSGQWEMAQRVLGALRVSSLQLDAVAANCGLGAFAWREVLARAHAMPCDGLAPTPVTYCRAVGACETGGAWQQALLLLRAMVRSALRSSLTWNCGISACGSSWRHALQLASTDTPDISGISAAICALDARWRVAAALCRRASETLLQHDAAFYGALLGTSSWRRGRQLLGAMEARGLSARAVLRPAAISSCQSQFHWASALSCLKGRSPALAESNGAVSACAQRWRWASWLAANLSEHGQRPDVYTLSAVVDACDRCRQWRPALAWLQRMTGLQMNAVAFNGAASALRGAWRLAWALLPRMAQHRLTVGHVQREALHRAAEKCRAPGVARAQEEALLSESVRHLRVAGFERGGPPCGGLPLAEAKAKVDQFLGSLPEGGQASSVLPYQKEGLAFGLHRAGRVLLGDEMGLGKTLQALLLAAYFEAEWPILVIAPSSLRFVWRDQAAQWLPHLVGEDGNLVHVVRNSKDKVSKSARVVVATYDLLRRCEALRRRTDGRDYLAVIVDESQSIKESTSQRTKVVVGICKAARRVLLLSGTPAVNRAAELYTQLEALLPSGMPSFAQFAERYSYKQVARFGGRSTVKWNGAQRTPELNSLLGTVMIRRLKKDVLQQLPPKRRVKVPLDPEKMNQETLKEAERQSRQMGPSDFVASKGLGDCAQLFRLTAEAKLGAVLEYVEHLLSTGAKFLLFGHHHLVLDAVQAKLQRMHCGHIRIDGHTSAVARPALVSQFQEDESVRVAVLSITAAGTGLTLTAAQTIVFAELYWVPGLMQQAEDRAHRIGQRDSVTVHYLIAKKTLDEVLFQTLEKKTFSTTGILNGLSSGLDVTCQGTQKRERESEEEPPTKRQRESSP